MITDFLVSVLTSAALSGALLAVAAWLGKSWAAERIKNEVSHIYAVRLEAHRTDLKKEADKELELLRGQVAEARALHSAATSAFSSAYSATNERRLRAVETLWSEVVRTRLAVNQLLVPFDALTPEETETALKMPDEYLSTALKRLTPQRMTEIFESTNPAPEVFRPFVSEALWVYFNGYRILLARVLLSYIAGKDAGQLRHWVKDRASLELCESLLTSRERVFWGESTVSPLGRAQALIELKILEKAREAISGQLSTDATLEETNRIRNLLEKSAKATTAV